MLDPVILLAGGRSSRMGMPKGLIPVQGIPLLLWQWARLREVGVLDVILVLGFGAESYRPLFPQLDRAGIRFQLVRNHFPERGPFSSMLVGLSRCNGPAFLLPVDVPCPTREVWHAIKEVVKKERAVIPFFGNHGGHPVWLSGDFVAELRAHPPTDRLDEIIRGLPLKQKRRLDVADSRVVANWNTPESLRKSS